MQDDGSKSSQLLQPAHRTESRESETSSSSKPSPQFTSLASTDTPTSSAILSDSPGGSPSSVSRSITQTPYPSVFSVFSIKKSPPAEDSLEEQKLSEFNRSPAKKLMNDITTLLQDEMIEKFTSEAEKLTSADAKVLAEILSNTKKDINGKLASELENFLETIFKVYAGRRIDEMHTTYLYEPDTSFPTDEPQELELQLEPELSGVKLTVYRAVIRISLLEKLLFPTSPLECCQDLISKKGFSFTEKLKLGNILLKIDSQFELQNWLWNRSPRLRNSQVKFFRNSDGYDVTKVIKLDSKDPADHSKKSSCCCSS